MKRILILTLPVLLLLTTTGAGPTWADLTDAPTVAVETPKPGEDFVPGQINPDLDQLELKSFYYAGEEGGKSNLHIRVALLVVPDPRIPRHRRAYDESIAAVNQGMQRAGYVLDRYAFPWQAQLQGEKPVSDATIADDGKYGILLFRQDLWRSSSKQGNRIIALYVVPEAATYGVQTKALKKALVGIDRQLQQPGIELAGFGEGSKSRLIIIGPNFSGSLDSIRHVSLSLPEIVYFDPRRASGHEKIQAAQEKHEYSLINLRELDLISGSTTVATNEQINQSSHLSYTRLALSDQSQTDTIRELSERLGIRPSEVVILQESSIFGNSFCSAEDVAFCTGAIRMNFPANIADVRYGLRQKKARLLAAQRIPLQKPSGTFNLDDGAENGSEFPESHQSTLTAASSHLRLNALLDDLKGQTIKIIVIVATDVRDRLFLIERLRAGMNRAQLIDLSTDNLMSYPDFLHASRGALLMASTPLHTQYDADLRDICSGGTPPPAPGTHYFWSSDAQCLLADIVASLDSKRPSPRLTTRPHLVTHKGIVSTESLPQRKQASSVFLIFVILALLFLVLGINHSYKKSNGPSFSPPEVWDEKAAILAVIGPVLFGVSIITMVMQAGDIAASLLAFAVPATSISLWNKQKKWYTPRAPLLVSLLTFSMTFGCSMFVYLLSTSRESDDAITSLLRVVNSAPLLGMSYYAALAVALTASIYCAFSQLNFALFIERNSGMVMRALAKRTADKMFSDSALIEPMRRNWPTFVLISLALFAFEGIRIRGAGFRVTPFGPEFDWCVWFGMIVTLLMSLSMLLNAMAVSARIFVLTRLFLGCTRSTATDPLLWETAKFRPAFASTPILAISSPGGSSLVDYEKNARVWESDLTHFITHGSPSRQSRCALYALLSSEIFLYQRAILGVALCTLASAAIVYFYPVTDAEIILLLNLGTLLVAGVFSGYATVCCELDMVLSNVLCNKSGTTHFSFGLIGYVAFPFAVLSVAIAIADIPGVLDWGGGIFSMLLGKLTPMAIP